MERRGLVRTPFLSAACTSSSLPPTAELSCCGARSQPHGTQPLLCSSRKSHPLGFHCSLQAPIPYPLRLCGAPQGGAGAHSSQHCPGLTPGGAVTTAGPPARPLPASRLVSRPFVPHQGLSRERPLSCTEVLTAAAALALLCLSLGGHLLSWGVARKLFTLARSCHLPCGFHWCLVDTRWWHRGWGLAHMQGMCPRSC